MTDASTAAWDALHAAVSARSERVATALDRLWSGRAATLTTSAGREAFLADVLSLVLTGYAENGADALAAYNLAREAAGLGPIPAHVAVAALGPDRRAVLSGVDGAVQRHLDRPDGAAARGAASLAAATAKAVALAADGASDTVRRQAARDPAALGWTRYDNIGTTCDRCLVLIARGPVYSERTATFTRHPRCTCGARAVFRGEPLPVQTREALALYRQTADGEFTYPDGHRLGGVSLSLRSVLAYKRAGRLDEFRHA